jgi:hypothetical protein
MDNKIDSEDPGIFKMILAICGRVLIIKMLDVLEGTSSKKKKSKKIAHTYILIK